MWHNKSQVRSSQVVAPIAACDRNCPNITIVMVTGTSHQPLSPTGLSHRPHLLQQEEVCPADRSVDKSRTHATITTHYTDSTTFSQVWSRPLIGRSPTSGLTHWTTDGANAPDWSTSPAGELLSGHGDYGGTGSTGGPQLPINSLYG